MLRVQHSSQCGRGVVFPLPYQTLLVGFKVGNPLPDFFALRATPIHGLLSRSFDQIGGRRLFATNGPCEGHRLTDECIKISLPISHDPFPLRPIYRGNRESAMSGCG